MESLGGKYPLLITSFEFGCCAFLSAVWLLFNRARLNGSSPAVEVPTRELLKVSILVLSSLLSGNISLRWVSYPVKVVVKSCKLLPTMALGSVLLRKRYSGLDQAAALFLCAGLVGFTLAARDAKSNNDEASSEVGNSRGAESSLLGVGMLLFAVSCDAVQVLAQERMLQGKPNLTPMHVMLHTNGFAFVAVVLAITATGELEGMPERIPWMRLVLYGTSSWVGVCCFIALTRSWGATAAVVTTNTRKLLTIVLSFIIFPKPVRPAFALSAVAVVAGVSCHSVARRRARRALEVSVQPKPKPS